MEILQCNTIIAKIHIPNITRFCRVKRYWVNRSISSKRVIYSTLGKKFKFFEVSHFCKYFYKRSSFDFLQKRWLDQNFINACAN